ncbi:MAG: MBL fold metallo-hydrolase, partial [Lactococcus sp.]|nr:MBL fold metallo-hydrolase [Lactococcus sp.]
GDALFSGSIGITDLPFGDKEVLLNGIKTELFTLPDQFRVFPGHREATTIGKEKDMNPFFN